MNVVYCSLGLAICNRFMSCARVALNRAWVCVRGVMCVYMFVLQDSIMEDVCALYLNAIVEMLLDFACIFLCFYFVFFVFVASFHVCQCAFVFPFDFNLRLVGISTVLC